MMVSAIQSSATQATANAGTTGRTPATSQPPKPLTVNAYRSSKGSSVEDYFKRFDWALQLSKIPEEQHANYARVYMGAKLNNALKFLISPRLPEDLTYKELRTILIRHFNRPKNKYVESIKFCLIVQQKGETIAAFALRLRQGSAHCQYDEFIDRMLIEQFLHGLSTREICDEIIAKKPSTFAEAYEIANSLEATRNVSNEVKVVGVGTASETVYKLGYASQCKRQKKGTHQKSERNKQRNPRFQRQGDKRSSEKKERICASCGGPHARDKCRFREAICHNCGQKEHIAKVCKAPKQIQAPAETMDQVATDTQPATRVDTVQRLDKLSETDRYDISKRTLAVNIDGRNLEMELDTGAPCGIVSKKTLLSIKPNCKLFKTDRRFASYTGHHISCIGRTPVTVTLGMTTRKLDLYVVDGNFYSLFGREWISQFTHEIKFHELFDAPDRIHTIITETSNLREEQKIRLE
ncbi:uncharacterized protein [Temnothorax longispinosus]|uniref:uncharacterized protein n=1 Tax=Temnothorax longispinosus TaxID=300112 RepID=UPI003A99FF1E